MTQYPQKKYRYNLERYNNLRNAYKTFLAREQGIDPAKYKLPRNSPEAARFKDFYKLLTTKEKPYRWRKELGKLGFGPKYWQLYRESHERK